MRDIRFVIIHTPGPQWQPDRSMFEQRGVAEHIAHFRQLLDAGKLELGGPFLDAVAGGMMIPAEGVPEADIVAFANADPAVVSGLLRVAVRPWMVGMKK